MATIIGVRFREVGRVYYFDPGETEVKKGSRVIVETARGVECGEVMQGNTDVPEEEIKHPLKTMIRVATPEDLQALEGKAEKEAAAFKICEEKIQKHALEMRLVNVEYTFDASKIIFYFTADQRVDFRMLVRDLAGVFRTRIELRQIGVRDEAKLLGGLGMCGRPFCCSLFMGDFHPVSIKMAKEQGLSLNPTKISGTCGRLMCCLKYEEAAYEDALKRLPKAGSFIETPDGRGTVLEVNAVSQTLKVRLEKQPDTPPVLFQYNETEGVKRKQSAVAEDLHLGGLSEPELRLSEPSETPAPRIQRQPQKQRQRPTPRPEPAEKPVAPVQTPEPLPREEKPVPPASGNGYWRQRHSQGKPRPELAGHQQELPRRATPPPTAARRPSRVNDATQHANVPRYGEVPVPRRAVQPPAQAQTQQNTNRPKKRGGKPGPKEDGKGE
jgi:cell fate regulator YaaT (PSP1 superfamily)